MNVYACLRRASVAIAQAEIKSCHALPSRANLSRIVHGHVAQGRDEGRRTGVGTNATSYSSTFPEPPVCYIQIQNDRCQNKCRFIDEGTLARTRCRRYIVRTSPVRDQARSQLALESKEPLTYDHQGHNTQHPPLLPVTPIVRVSLSALRPGRLADHPAHLAGCALCSARFLARMRSSLVQQESQHSSRFEE